MNFRWSLVGLAGTAGYSSCWFFAVGAATRLVTHTLILPYHHHHYHRPYPHPTPPQPLVSLFRTFEFVLIAS